MDYLELWSSFSNRISSIYLPDKKRPMLPNILSECLCSLNENEYHISFVLDITIKDNTPVSHKLSICNAYISKNFTYSDNIEPHVKGYDKIKSFFKAKGTSELVLKSMTYINHYIAKYLHNSKVGIFKRFKSKKDETIPETLPENIRTHIQVLRNNAASYELYNNQQYNSITNTDIDVYLQASSPIRRLVDLLNNIALVKEIQPDILSEKSNVFYTDWIEKLEYINLSSRMIRKIQFKCDILEQHEKNKKNNPNKTYIGYIFDRYEKKMTININI